MQNLSTANHRAESELFDPNGFMRDPDAWDRDLAIELAQELGVGDLHEPHWSVIDYLREHYLSSHTLPWEGNVCRELDLTHDCVHRLFGGPLAAWRLAGLPDPGEEARTYMQNLQS
jgi:tRNA 2-thiouridine synthesizing protein E